MGSYFLYCKVLRRKCIQKQLYMYIVKFSVELLTFFFNICILYLYFANKKKYYRFLNQIAVFISLRKYSFLYNIMSNTNWKISFIAVKNIIVIKIKFKCYIVVKLQLKYMQFIIYIIYLISKIYIYTPCFRCWDKMVLSLPLNWLLF